MTQKQHEWLSNPGDNEKTPDPDLDPGTIVQVRYDRSDFFSRPLPDGYFDDEGSIESFYWQIDDEAGDIEQYRIKEPA